ncbi:hypothetical protein [Polaromonas sp.]|uniref:hypothetical protein n=1 Tax=Polaromonas sp. TaxID=1869339 RepID=UPI003C8A81B9
MWKAIKNTASKALAYVVEQKNKAVAFVSGVSLTVGSAIAQTANPLVTAATTETGAAKTNLLEVAGLLFIVTLEPFRGDGTSPGREADGVQPHDKSVWPDAYPA